MKVIHKKSKEVFVGDRLYVKKGVFALTIETYVYLMPYYQRLLIITGDVGKKEALRKLKEEYDIVDE